MVQIQRHKPGWILTAEQLLPARLDDAFDFFSRAENLEQITPPWLHFCILNPDPIDMRLGAQIDYHLRLHGIPISWRTAITGWSPPYSFVDTQLRGPYRRWVHTHTFESHPAGTLMRDEVQYDVWGGTVINDCIVKRDLQRIFEFRAAALSAIFPGPLSSPASSSGAAT